MKRIDTNQSERIIKVYKLEKEISELERNTHGVLFTSSTEEKKAEHLKEINSRIKEVADLKKAIRGYSTN